ncbi:MAG: hypothetical protein IJW34_02730 [Clostridia bacterium]|nr:hypothetical protein [Clostridia bacterium]
MKAKKLLWITLTLVVSSALLLTGSLALLAGATEGESPLPEASALPDISDIPTEGENVELPGETVGDTVLTEKDGKITASFLTLEELTLLQERRDGGEWLTLSLEEMTAIVEETVRMFYTSHVLEVGALVDGVYTVESYNGYLFYTDEGFERYDVFEAPDVGAEICKVICARLAAYNDAQGGKGQIYVENWVQIPQYFYFFADMPAMDAEALGHACISDGHVDRYETDWTRDSYGYVRVDIGERTVIAVTHDTALCKEKTYKPVCLTKTEIGFDKKFREEFIGTQLEENSRKVRVEIFEEATQTLVDTFTITDSEKVAEIFAAQKAAMDKAINDYDTTTYIPEDSTYRSKYRVVVHLERTNGNLLKYHNIDFAYCYPYGYTNEIYGCVWENQAWVDYNVPGGKVFLDLMDVYVTPFIPEE